MINSLSISVSIVRRLLQYALFIAIKSMSQFSKDGDFRAFRSIGFALIFLVEILFS
jgi:hypothetical protein